MNKIPSFIALTPLKSLLLPSAARAEIPSRLHEIFSDFLARLAGPKILVRFAKNRARIFSPGLIAPRDKYVSM